MIGRSKALRSLLLLAAAGVAGAQSDFDVTMRVVDDVRGLNAVVIVIGADATLTPAEPAKQADGAAAPVQ